MDDDDDDEDEDEDDNDNHEEEDDHDEKERIWVNLGEHVDLGRNVAFSYGFRGRTWANVWILETMQHFSMVCVGEIGRKCGSWTKTTIFL